MSLLSWILFGLIAGSLANFLDSSPSRGGWLGSIVLGVVGAVVGGFLANLIFGVSGVSGFNLESLVVAVLGALLLLFAQRAFRRSV